MADKKLNIKVATKGTKKAKGNLKGVDSSLKSLGKTAMKVGGAFFAAQGIIRGLKAVVSAAAEQELAEKKLSSQLGKTSNKLLKKARALQQVTMYGDEATLGVMASISAFEKDEDAIAKATQATLDMASAMGMDLKAAGDLVAKTLGSSTNALTRYGVEVTGAVGSTERLESLTRGIAGLWGGQATAQAETMTGSIEQMKNAVGDTAEVIGSVLSPVIVTVAGWLKSGAEWAGNFFNSLTETPLEKTIRELKDLGAATESIARLEKIALERNLIKLNNELKFSKGFYSDIDELQKVIIENGEEQSRLATVATDGEADLINLNKEFIDLQNTRLAMIRREGEYSKIPVEELNKMITANSDLMGAKTESIESLEEEISLSGEKIEKIAEESEKLGENLKLLTDIKTAQAEISLLSQDSVTVTEDITTATQEYAAAIEELNPQLREYKTVIGEINLEQQKFSDETAPITVDALQGIWLQLSKGIPFLKTVKDGFVEVDTASADATGKMLGLLAKLNDATKASGKQSKLWAKTQKGLLIGESVMHTYSAAVKMLDPKYGGTPPLNYIQSAAVITAGLANIVNITRQKFAEGGLVRGSGSGDTVPAMLTPGEFVLTKEQTKSIGLTGSQGIAPSQNINVTFSGNVLSQDFIEDEALPMIKEALRRGGDLGIA